MKRPIFPHDNCNWVSVKTNPKRTYVTKDGKPLNAIYFRYFSKTTHALIISEGDYLSRYRYPNTEILFKSDMHDWENILFCGGYNNTLSDGRTFDSPERIVEQVIQKKKPFGGIVVYKTELNKFLKILNDSNLIYLVQEHFQEDMVSIDFTSGGKIQDLFDITSLITSYNILLNKHFDTTNEEYLDTEAIIEMTNMNLEDYLGYDYANPKSSIDCIFIGLLLGFPVESTFAFMVGAR